MCLAQGHNAVTPVMLEPTTPRSGVKHSTTEPLIMYYSDLAFLIQVLTWKQKLPLQTIMRMLQVLVPQVEKICIDK